jgi:hypothetical protein
VFGVEHRGAFWEGSNSKRIFFFEKKEAKNFYSIKSIILETPRVPQAQSKLIKVFCFFFSKKKPLPSP